MFKILFINLSLLFFVFEKFIVNYRLLSFSFILKIQDNINLKDMSAEDYDWYMSKIWLKYENMYSVGYYPWFLASDFWGGRPDNTIEVYNSFFSNYFIFFALLCMFFSYRCVWSKNIIEVLYSFVCVFLTSSGCLFCINVEFLAIVNVTVYVGAIIVLFLFSTMLLNFRESSFINFWVPGPVIVFFLSCFFIFFIELYEDAVHCLNSLKSSKPSLFVFDLENIDFVYLIDFCVQDIRIFQNLYLEFGAFLLLAALILLVAMLAAVSLCLSSKSLRPHKKFLKIF